MVRVRVWVRVRVTVRIRARVSVKVRVSFSVCKSTSGLHCAPAPRVYPSMSPAQKVFFTLSKRCIKTAVTLAVSGMDAAAAVVSVVMLDISVAAHNEIWTRATRDEIALPLARAESEVTMAVAGRRWVAETPAL